MKTQRFLLVAILGTTIWACSRQGEGERCVLSNANADCESGLECTPADKLNQNNLTGEEYKTERCCPPDGQTWSDSRCDRKTRGTPAGSGGASATGGTSSSIGGDTSAAGSGANSSGGAAGATGEPSSVESRAGNSGADTSAT
ncbi:MAG TPA: hypothetical protein VIV60_14030, partial [Polyangiaceae bacterium]